MKSIVLPGQKSNASYEKCGRFVPATWGFHPDSPDDGTLVENVMQTQCDVSGDLLSVDGQPFMLSFGLPGTGPPIASSYDCLGRCAIS
jgi:hypothetical protein